MPYHPVAGVPALHDMLLEAVAAGHYEIEAYARGIGPGVDIPGEGYHVRRQPRSLAIGTPGTAPGAQDIFL